MTTTELTLTALLYIAVLVAIIATHSAKPLLALVAVFWLYALTHRK